MIEKFILPLIIICGVVLCIYVIKLPAKRRHLTEGNNLRDLHKLKDFTNSWVSYLNATTQFKLALQLVNFTMFEWDNYLDRTFSSTSYPSTEKHLIETDHILTAAMHAIKNCSKIIPDKERYKQTHFKKCLEEFSYLVTTICDGTWELPHSINKLILSIFNILKGLDNEQSQSSSAYFMKSIGLSIEIISLHDPVRKMQLKFLLENYRIIALESELVAS